MGKKLTIFGAVQNTGTAELVARYAFPFRKKISKANRLVPCHRPLLAAATQNTDGCDNPRRNPTDIPQMVHSSAKSTS